MKRGRVWVADGLTFFNRSSPRVVESAQIVAEAVWPELSGAAAAAFDSSPLFILPSPVFQSSKDYRMISFCGMSASRGTVQARSQVCPRIKSPHGHQGDRAAYLCGTSQGLGMHARRSALHDCTHRSTE